jgi:putative membrane protein insertion efficiency factor
MKTLLVWLVTFYQRAVSPWLPRACRYQPTCSAYFIEAVERYGSLKGSWLGLRRLVGCHPFGRAGHDPIP